eukprot:TRINITY_DN3201_c0_g1_i1.p1 TRINITY_DN3201_c0_g1~~TRINITY_DN3201_c0_g1_i1.p1  ORF type:complete len:802 (-),score=172.02 TRINITY_DN3201_c0_g1_i1:329-2734(-)
MASPTALANLHVASGPRALVLNLERRPDRRRWMCKSCLPALCESGGDAAFLPAIDGRIVEGIPRAKWWPLSPEAVDAVELHWKEYFPGEPLGSDELKRFYGREISAGEVGVFLSHRAAWKAAQGASWSLILEDDAAPVTFLPPGQSQTKQEEEQRIQADRDESFFRLCAGRWTSVWGALRAATEDLRRLGVDWDMLLLGRNRFGEDDAVEGEYDVVQAGFSTCLHAYAVSNEGAERLLKLTETGPNSPIIPIDDLLPAVWTGQHPRSDVEAYANCLTDRLEGRPLKVLAFREELVWQLESLPAADGQGIGSLFRSLMGSDIDTGSAWDRTGVQGFSLSDEKSEDHIGLSNGSLLERLFEEDGGTCGSLTLRCAVFAGPEAFVQLRSTGRRLRVRLAEEAGWRAFVLGFLQERNQSEPEEDPFLSKFYGSWRLTAFAMVSTGECGNERPQKRMKLAPEGSQSGDDELKKAHQALENLQAFAKRMADTGDAAVAPPMVESRSASALATAEFRRDFEALPGVPLRLRGAAALASKLGCDPWRLEALTTSLSQQPCRCHIQEDALALTSGRTRLSVLRLPFQEYLLYMKSNQDVEPLYLFQEVDADLQQAIDPTFGPPLLLAEDFLAEVVEPPEGFTGLNGWLLVGPPGSGSRWHFDPWGTAAWNLLFEGRKLWAFAPPTSDSFGGPSAPPGVKAQTMSAGLADEAAKVYYSAPAALGNLAAVSSEARQNILWTIQEPGDLIFIPSGWWHSTVCLTDTSAYTRNYINSHNYRRAIEALSKLHANVSSQLERWVWKLHMDDDSDVG